MKYVLIAALLLFSDADAATRSSAARLSFTRHNACPATGLFTRSCGGYVVDHVKPLCAGGADAPSNMQWQEYQASLLKDAQERRLCRSLHN